MKLFLTVLFAVIAASKAEIDWDTVFHLENQPAIFSSIRISPEGRVVGGDEATPHQFPHQVGLFSQLPIGQAFCGGSLIDTTHVLTAAHCADGASNFTVVLGAHKIQSDEPTQVKIAVNKAVIHPKYDSRNIVNDLAILTLPNAVELNANIKTIRLPSRSEADTTFAGEQCTISGWGKDSDSSSTISPVLRFVSNPVLTNDVCSQKMLNLEIPPTQVCMSGENHKGSCNGDSGGPLIVTDSDGQITQIGITSYGLIFGCALNFPAAYTRVSKYLDWIEENSNVEIRPY